MWNSEEELVTDEPGKPSLEVAPTTVVQRTPQRLPLLLIYSFKFRSDFEPTVLCHTARTRLTGFLNFDFTSNRKGKIFPLVTVNFDL